MSFQTQLLKYAILCILLTMILELVCLRINELEWKEMNSEKGNVFCYLNNTQFHKNSLESKEIEDHTLF